MSVSPSRDSHSILTCIESYLPGERGGGPVRALANLVAQLEDSHHFDVLTRNHDYLVSQAYSEIEPNVWLNDRSACICYATEAHWCQQLLKRLEEFPPQWLYLNGAFAPMTRRVLHLRHRYNHLRSIPILVSPKGNLGPGAIQHHALRKRAWLLYAKVRRLYDGVYWHAASEREAAQIRAIFGGAAAIRIVPNAPAVSSRRPGGRSQKEEGRGQRADCTLRLVYFGRLSPEKNLSFALDLLTRFVEAHPDRFVIFDLYHSDDLDSELQRLARSLPDRLQINFISGLSHEALQALLCAEGYSALLMPSLSENFSYTVLEAMQAGISPLISDQTPWRDLESEAIGWDLPLSDPTPWLAALDELADEDLEQQARRCDRALAYVEKWVAEYPTQARELFVLPVA